MPILLLECCAEIITQSVIGERNNSRFSRDVTAAMLVYRTIAKKVFWEFDSTIMQNLSDILPLFCTPTWPSHHVSENQEEMSLQDHPSGLRLKKRHFAVFILLAWCSTAGSSGAKGSGTDQA